MGLKTHEPSVDRVVGGACFPKKIGALQGALRPGCGATAGDFLQQAVHHKGVTFVNGSRLFGQIQFRCSEQHAAAVIGDLADQLRLHQIPTVGEDRIAGGHLHGGDRAGAQGQCEVGRVALGVKAKPGDPVLGALCAHHFQDPNRDHVFGHRQRPAKRHGARKLAVVVLRLPRLTARLSSGVEQGRVVDDGGGGHAFFQGGRIHKGFETGAGLTPSLCDVVELCFLEIKATHQSTDVAGARVECHKSRFDLGLLGDEPGLFGVLHHTNHRTRSNFDFRTGLGRERGLDRQQALLGDLKGHAILAHSDHLGRAGVQHHRGVEVAVVRDRGDGIVDGIVQCNLVRRQVNEPFRTPVNLPLFVIE